MSLNARSLIAAYHDIILYTLDMMIMQGNRILVIFSAITLLLLCFAPSGLSAQESGEETESGGEILQWDVDYGTVAVPQTAEASEALREEEAYRFAEGTGAYFGYVSSLEPWDFFDRYGQYPESAWKPPLPYYFGVAPPLNSPFYIKGTCSIFDNSGHLVVRKYTVVEPPKDGFGGTTWHVLGNITRSWEDWMNEPIEYEGEYLPVTLTGVKYFLNQVHLRGIVGGEKMKDLLEQVNAKEISIQRTHRDERIGVFYIPPTAEEWENWVAEMYVWVNMKSWKIERHQVDLLYGRESCQYYNQLWDVQPDISGFYLEWLPTRILDQIAEEYELEITDEEPLGEDEYIGHDEWIKISGKKQDEEVEQEKEEDTGEESQE